MPRRDRDRVNPIRIVLAILFAAAPAAADEPKPAAKKLIEFGWDEPDTAFLRKHAAELEASPFDGCVFHANAVGGPGQVENFAWVGWGRRAFREADLADARRDLEATAPRRFTHNFLRFNTAPGDLDWFDDHDAALGNARLAATLARAGRCAGVLFDVEEYQGGLFTYAKQRDAKTKTWDEYAAQATRRGREVMSAFQEGFPDLTVFLTFGHTLSRAKSGMGKTPLAESEYGLLAPFLDGMVDASRGNARIVDGFELSYGYKEASRFDDGRRLMKEGVLPVVADPAKYAKVVSAGFGLWMDYDWRKYGWDEADPSKNYFTPDDFAASLRHALARSDEYVWVYTETPRWWSEPGGRVKLPDAYDRAVRGAR